MIQTARLQNGITVVMEKIPYIKSISFGVWVKSGSAYEPKELCGISHFIEHMVFKGTETRSATQIAQEMDNIGGQMNAFTSKENTCFYAKTLDTHLDSSVNLLCDMLFHSRFAASDLATEQRVVAEEIDMYEDTPDELVLDVLAEQVWGNGSLARPILGTKETLKQFDTATLRRYMREHYTAENMVLALAGNIRFDAALDLLENTFGREALQSGERAQLDAVMTQGGVALRAKEIEQTHLCLCYRGLSSEDKRGYDLSVANSVFGGAMGSRLFQRIREEKGLAYSVYSFPVSYENAGLLCVYAATNPANAKTVLDLIREEVYRLTAEGLSEDEVQKAKEQLKCSYILGMESSSSRMSALGKSQLMRGRVKTQNEVLKKCDAVTVESVQEVIQEVFGAPELALSAVGVIPEELRKS